MAAQTKKNNFQNEQDVDVLYQKLGGQWFAFSIINDDVFMSPVSDDQISEIMSGSNEQKNYQNNNEAA